MSQVTEDTPLLSGPTGDGSGFSSDEPNPSAVEIHQERCAQAIFILTWHSAVLAVFLLGSHLTIIAMHYIRTGDAVPWGQEVVEVGLLCTVCSYATHFTISLRRGRSLTKSSLAHGRWNDLIP